MIAFHQLEILRHEQLFRKFKVSLRKFSSEIARCLSAFFIKHKYFGNAIIKCFQRIKNNGDTLKSLNKNSILLIVACSWKILNLY